MSSRPPSLNGVHDDVISRVLYFAPYIWDVLNFTATSRRMNRLSEQHLKSLKYLDIRISCKWYSCPIMEGVKKLCLHRCGQLAEIKILNPERFISDTEFINGLHVLPVAQKRLAKEAALFRLHCQRFFDGTTIAKQSSLHLDGNPMLLRYSREINNLDLDSVRYFRNDFSAIKRMCIPIDVGSRFHADAIHKCCFLFTNLEEVCLKFVSFITSHLSASWILKAVDCFKEVTDNVVVELSHKLVLAFPKIMHQLTRTLPKVHIYSDLTAPSPRSGDYPFDYEAFEIVLKEDVDEKYHDEFLRSVSRSKDVRDFSNEEEQVLAFYGQYTENIRLQFTDEAVNQLSASLASCIKANCPNLTSVTFQSCKRSSNDFINYDDTMVHLIEQLGPRLENLTIDYANGNVSLRILLTILNHCPKLERFESKSRESLSRDDFKGLLPRFRQMARLDYFGLKNNEGELQYCNDKLSFLDSEWTLVNTDYSFFKRIVY
ncbi:hypothetical protein HDE_12815 [Halotydeus destructor]|nr:hypothetical protein HDE_12815 [Halotydeus destructor]